MKFSPLLLLTFLLLSCDPITEIERSPPLTPEELKKHSEEFRKEIITVTEGIHVAIGYSLANSMMVEGKKGKIII